MKTSCMLFLLVCSLSVRGQAIPYGNNAVAGKYQLVNGVRLYYETYGKGKPLLLIHGNGGSISSFSKNIPYFARNYRVIAVDSRAHGKSIDPGDTLSFELMADDFAALLTSLRIDSAYVIGWSDGGINALLLAMQHPEKVKKLVATGANLWPDSTALVPSLWKQMQKEYVEKKDKPRTSPKDKNDWKVFALDVLQPNIPLQALHAIKSPSLIMAGDRDLIVTAHTVAIAQHLPNSWLWIVPNCGHATLIDRADEFNNKVSEFFRFK
ncbi:alpha/beta fold hydrolase [Fibrella forsythiae]|uniref:Alpha/beta hydrolase n=1 Tax=Fibrella forsythiae TaxID=2817061 RepID=A0ABS3JN94_9BACT|nr:alpha/beta hydrolase [Fibrella forsythiae]MBO0951450.1 alpha/beta hydrolase [Fibrella forsythiae]